jgi:hypothetical protein
MAPKPHFYNPFTNSSAACWFVTKKKWKKEKRKDKR